MTEHDLVKEMHCRNCDDWRDCVKVLGSRKCLECGHVHWLHS